MLRHTITSSYIVHKILAAPIGIVWLHAWLGPTNLFSSSGAAFLSLAPSSEKGYYATVHCAGVVTHADYVGRRG